MILLIRNFLGIAHILVIEIDHYDLFGVVNGKKHIYICLFYIKRKTNKVLTFYSCKTFFLVYFISFIK